MHTGDTHRIGVISVVIIAIFFFSVFSVVAQPTGAYSSGSQKPPLVGEVKQILGEALIGSPGQTSPTVIQSGTPIHLEETLFTEINSKAWWSQQRFQPANQRITLPGADISLGEKSTFEFLRYEVQDGSEHFVGEMSRGLIRYIKNLPKTNPPSSFTITTPTALIEVLVSDRAADFVIEVVNDRRTTIYGIWGAVKVRNISSNFREERVVRSCQKVDVDIDREPSPVQGVSPATLRQLITRTTIPGTLPEDVPNCGSTPEIVYEEPVIGFIPGGCPCPPHEELVGNRCVRCPTWRSYDPHTCRCSYRCRSDHHCRRCEWCDNGECRRKHCPPGEWLNPETCRCERHCRKTCPPGFRLNPRTCECERRCDKHCPPGQWLNPRTCECETRCNKQCLPGQKLNVEECRCEPRCQKQCGPNEWLNVSKCECEPRCNKQCPEGQILNKHNCRCEGIAACKKSCPPGFRLDTVTCRCEEVHKKEDQYKGCRSDGECGPGMQCRNGRCVPGFKDKPKSDFPKPHIDPKLPSDTQKPTFPPPSRGQDTKFPDRGQKLEIQKPDFQRNIPEPKQLPDSRQPIR